jgi:Xaa-Pro aminopeptidase
MDFAGRIDRLKGVLKKRRLDALLITSDVNVSYLSGFRGHDAMIIITPRKCFFITDFRYVEEAEETIEGFRIEVVRGSNYHSIVKVAKAMRLERMGFESMNLAYGVVSQLRKMVKGIRLVPIRGAVEEFRAVKDSDEVSLIKNSIYAAKSIYKRISDLVRPKVREFEISAVIESDIAQLKAKPAFSPIVAVDANSSKPHAIPGDRKIRKNSVVMIDLGVRLKGYCSDLTRTILLGRIPPEVKRIYEIVKAAQDRAIAKISPGVRIRDIDLSARGYIQRKGYGAFFGHSLGHGVGMEVHESPSLTKHNPQLIKEGMVFTVEPAIYIPGRYGVRLEEMVLVKRHGCEVLTGGI